MTVADLSLAGSRNLLRTYFALGMSSPGSSHLDEPGFEACLGNFDHPICNFAARIQLDPWVANRLIEIALERRSFNVYSIPGDIPSTREVRDEMLVRSGFKRSYSLQQMFWTPRRPRDNFALTVEELDAQRHEVAMFMANQFFARHSANFRRRVGEATYAAPGLRLFSMRQKGELVASLMLVEDDEVLGLFNLCVKPKLQGRGWGRSIVAEVQQRAYENGKHISLQCDETLSAWYESQGFVRAGWVDVYSLSDERRVAIIN
jgi:ribosomal protein S18 acetylase RimI-like enzyme